VWLAAGADSGVPLPVRWGVLDSSIVSVHWLKLYSEKPMCWYPPERWQNKPGQFRILPDDNGPGEWFEVSEGHVHVDEISTLQYKEAHQWLENVCMHFVTCSHVLAEFYFVSVSVTFYNCGLLYNFAYNMLDFGHYSEEQCNYC